MVNLRYYKTEYENVINLCKKNKECQTRLESIDPNSDSINLFKILEQFYELYWKENNCQQENEPCGINWGFCCNNLVCQYLNESSNQKYEFFHEPIGLCSFLNTTYIIGYY